MAVCRVCVGPCLCVPAAFLARPEVERALDEGDASALIRLAHTHVRSWSQHKIAEVTGLSQSMISRVVRYQREIKDPESVDAVLEAFSSHRRTPQGPTDPAAFSAPDPLNASFTDMAGMAVFGDLSGPALGQVEHLRPSTDPPTRVTAQDVAYLDHTTDLMERGDFIHGGGLSLAAVLGQLQHVHRLYQHASCTPQVRVHLESALARIAKVTGWMAFDAGDLHLARPCWALGLSMAKRAANAAVTTSLLTDMARASIHHDDPHEALQLLAMAAASALSSPATLRTAHAVVTARAHGARGDLRDCLAAIETAHDHYERRDVDDEPAWMAFFDHAQLSGDTGQALLPLALQGHEHERAVRLLEEAVDAHTPDQARAATLSRAKLVRLYLAGGDLDQARTTTQTLVETATRVRSARVHQDLRTIADDTVPYGGDADASWVRHRVHDALNAPGASGL